jgi:hypothetical protein
MSIQTHFDKFNKKIYLTSHSDGYKKTTKLQYYNKKQDNEEPAKMF